MLKTIEDLLLLTKIGYHPEALNFEQFDFIEFFSEIVDQNRLLAVKKAIEIKIHLNGLQSPLMVKGDRLHLRRLFFNIIGNAIKFTSIGGSIDMRIELGRGNIISYVCDTGPGIAPENLEKIFDEFYRADKNTPGSGLGLYIAYTIAKFHQGDIQVELQSPGGPGIPRRRRIVDRLEVDSPDLKVKSTTRPVRIERSFVRKKADPLPGLTNSVSTI